MIKSKKNQKNFSLLMVMVIIFATVGQLIFPSTQAYAANGKTTITTIERDVTYLTSELDGTTPVRMVDRLRNDIGNVVFCINFNLPSPDGLEYTSYDQLDNATSYLMNAFYNGNANLTGNKAIDEYIVQATIHNIKTPNEFSLDRAFVDPHGILPRIAKLKAEALQAPAPSTPVFDNQLSVDKSSVPSSISDNNYISEEVTVNVKGSGTVSAVLNNATPGSYIADENGNKLTQIQNGSKVRIVVPMVETNGMALNPSVSMEADFVQGYQVAVRYGGHAGFQDIAQYETKEFNENLKTVFSTQIDEQLGSIKGVKVTESEEPLEGVVFELQNEAGEKIQESVSQSDGTWGFNNISFGNYYWLETRTVEGYVINGERHAVTVNFENQNIDSGNFVNKLKAGKISFNKVDSDNNPLPGAEMTLTDNAGEQTIKETDEKGNVVFDIVANKTYTLEETKNPTGYKGTFKQEGITLENDGETFEYTAVNELKTGKITLNKVDKEGKILPGAEFTLTDNEGEKFVQVTNELGNVEFDIVANKTYTLEETKNPTGYKGTFKQENITLENDGDIFEYTATNELNVGKVKLNKVDQDGKALAGAEMTLTDNEGKKIVKVTNKEGIAEFDIVANKTYSLEETKNPTGYTGAFKQEGITVKNDGDVFEYTATNEKIKVAKIMGTFPKTGENTGSFAIIGILLIGLIALGFVVRNNRLKKEKNKLMEKVALYGFGGEQSIFSETEDQVDCEVATILVEGIIETGSKAGLKNEKAIRLLEKVELVYLTSTTENSDLQPVKQL